MPKQKRTLQGQRRRERAWVDDRYRNKFGMSIQEYENLFEKQGGHCAICREAEVLVRKNGVVKRLAVDHCHATGRVRGLLCLSCNHILGNAKDNIRVLEDAIEYLKTADTGFRVVAHTPSGKCLTPPDSESLLSELMGETDAK